MKIAEYKLRALGRVVHNLPDIALQTFTSMVGSIRPCDLYQDLFCIRNCTFVLRMYKFHIVTRMRKTTRRSISWAGRILIRLSAVL